MDAAPPRRPAAGFSDSRRTLRVRWTIPSSCISRAFGYLGISAVENGFTNICGIAPEEELRRFGFDLDEFLMAEPSLRDRLRPLSRRMAWLKTGPLVFSRSSELTAPANRVYPAGDALGFIDPFTGSGILNALLTGRLAGSAAARGTPDGNLSPRVPRAPRSSVRNVQPFSSAAAGAHEPDGAARSRETGFTA